MLIRSGGPGRGRGGGQGYLGIDDCGGASLRSRGRGRLGSVIEHMEFEGSEGPSRGRHGMGDSE